MSGKNIRTIGDELLNLLRYRNIENFEFARMMGISESILASWIAGRNTPTLDQYRRYCNLLGVQFDLELLSRRVEEITSKQKSEHEVELLHIQAAHRGVLEQVSRVFTEQLLAFKDTLPCQGSTD